MASTQARSRAVVPILLLLAAVAGGLVWWLSTRATLPAPGSPEYEAVATSYYRGLAQLEVGLLEDAQRSFGQTTTLVPGEPAGWAGIAVVRLRLGELETAEAPIRRALELAPDNSELALLSARFEIARGRLDEGAAQLRRAVMLEPGNLRARFALAEELERAGTPEGEAEALDMLEALLELDPPNLAVIVERARLAAKRQDAALLRDSVARLAAPAAAWPQQAAEQYAALRTASETSAFADAARRTALLRNVLARVPEYSASLTAVRTPAEVVAEPLPEFVSLASPPSTPAPADLTHAFQTRPLDAAPASALVAFSLDGESAPAFFAASASEIRRPGSDAAALPLPFTDSARPVTLLPLDWNNDFRVDLLAAGNGPIRLFLQGDNGSMSDATAAAGAPVSCDCSGAWAADVEMDGDLDIVLGVVNAPTIVLRNGGDGTWTPITPFAAVTDARGFGWADLDRDGDPDAVFLSGNRVRLLVNGRAGNFSELAVPMSMGSVSAMTIADIDADGVFDVVAETAEGGIRRASLGPGRVWDEQVLLPAAGGQSGNDVVRLFAADLDNNGGVDLIRSSGTSRVWLSNERFELQPLAASIDARVTSTIDLNGDGKLDLTALAGTPVVLDGSGQQKYHWKGIRVRAQATAGDQRINPFAVGGEIETRAGLLRQKQLLDGHAAHFGLGTRSSIDVARIVWPNGVPQAEFGAGVDDVIVAEQRLKGSCPWVFADDGTGMKFVTDFIWRSPLGLRINAQDTAGIGQTEDWIRIGGNQLTPRNGAYHVRITAELWETHFFDHVSLMVVDHPADTEIYVDERFRPGQPVAFAPIAVRDIAPVARVRDHRGTDVTEVVAANDGRFVSTFDRGRYQGIALDHFIEMDVNQTAPATSTDRPVLLARGWVYPTDSSINVAVAQGRHEQPRGLSLEAQDANGNWFVADAELGFPAGKNKTMVIDLTPAKGARRIRLRTNMELSWDTLTTAWTTAAPLQTTRLNTARSDLRYRGFSSTTSKRGNAPETPTYSPVAYTGQRWLDLEGYYTRFGEVGELLSEVDDRYVIMNAGDELAMQFTAPPPPSDGWTRDFVLIGDGWEKDGDFNTEFSRTVLPLPAHGPTPYKASADPESLENDPVYRRHRGDWERYHTRYVTPDAFTRGLGHGRETRLTRETMPPHRTSSK